MKAIGPATSEKLRSQSTAILKIHENFRIWDLQAKWWDTMTNYPSLPVILPHMKVVCLTTSEELHSQSEAGWTNKPNEKRKRKPICPHTIV